jgi:aryl-alcohol dehydrogenase-like predicted oxidoreductase
MKYRLLGPTGVWVSAVSLGTMNFGGKEHPLWGQFGGLDQADADRLVGTALDAGSTSSTPPTSTATARARKCSRGR